MKERLALVDDHVLLRNGLANLLRELGYEVVLEADNGRQFIEKLTDPLPDLVLLDINMPLLDGYGTAAWLQRNHPGVHVLALSMLDEEGAIIRMLRNGAKGYILKDCEPDELKAAVQAVLEKGFYHSELVTGKLVHAVKQGGNDNGASPSLTEKELQFLKWACTELSYKEIADRMGISPRTVDTYRDNLQEKLDCKGRIGLALWAIKNGVATV